MCDPEGGSTQLLPTTLPSVRLEEEVVEPGTTRGPRIKHVCRKAAVALGTPATFPPLPTELRLSALPLMEKEKILKKDEQDRPGMFITNYG